MEQAHEPRAGTDREVEPNAAHSSPGMGSVQGEQAPSVTGP